MQTEGCFIATAVFGNYDSEPVIKLRLWRDTHLMPSKLGRILVFFYYRIGPYLSKIVDRNPRLKTVLKTFFERLSMELGK